MLNHATRKIIHGNYNIIFRHYVLLNDDIILLKSKITAVLPNKNTS